MTIENHHKHRRSSSSSDDEEKSSKRHKHHRHHHKHRHHKHRSKKREVHFDDVFVPANVEDDVEEGEIREEDENLDVEVGQEDGFNLGKDVKMNGGDSTVRRGDLDIRGSPENDKDKRGHMEDGSPSRGSRKGKSKHEADVREIDKDELEEERDLLSNNITEHKSKSKARSSSRDRYHDEIRHRSRSRSHDRLRARSRSRSILDEEHQLERMRYHERDYSYTEDRTGGEFDTDEEKRARRHGSRGRQDSERERSVSHSRYTGEDDARHRRESRENYRSREIDAYYERRREKERGRSRDLDSDWDRRGELDRRMDRGKSKERDMERDRGREKERERGRDDRISERERYMDRERRRERDWDLERGRGFRREMDSEREREIYTSQDIRGDRNNYGDKYRNSRHSRHEEKAGRADRTKDHSPKSFSGGEDTLNGHDNEDDGFEERVSSQLAEQEDEDLKRIEESRRRKHAILEKYKNQLSQQKNESPIVVEKGNNNVVQANSYKSASNISTGTPDGRNEGVEVNIADASFSVGKSPQQNGTPAAERASGARGLGEGTPKDERSNDMFRDDIFGDSPADVRKSVNEDGLRIERSGLYDNWDDAEGYYSYRFGEILDGHYEIAAAHGKGVFSTVVRAKDLKAGVGDPEEVAIKIIRNNETMYKAGMDELVILKKLVGADPENKRHCVRYLSSFKYRNHLCLVFESLNMNLREVLKKFGRNIGLKLTAVRAYAKQLFIALKHLRNCGVLHCDIKPDNMLVNETKNVLKLCDFGNAMFAGKNEITPYLVSRFYRAPEIILGLTYDHPLDMWSVGCCLYELYTGKVLFPGCTNNDMLRLHMELKGFFPKKMLRKAAFADQHFDHDLNFHALEEDPVTRKTMKRVIVNIKPKDFGSLVKGSSGEDPKLLANFKDLLEKIFILDPDKRLTVSQALSHPFITGYLPLL